MFTGIIETTGRIKEIREEGSNRRFTIEATFTAELKVDQSISHNGVCLTVEKISDNTYEVVAIEETLKRSNFRSLKIDDVINLERSLKIGDRLDGHFVQGHVEQIAKCKGVVEKKGSWLFTFEISESNQDLLVNKGSICINGVSLTIVDVVENEFNVAVIPYTYSNTNFKTLQKGSLVNIEFDVIGKYVKRIVENNYKKIVN